MSPRRIMKPGRSSVRHSTRESASACSIDETMLLYCPHEWNFFPVCSQPCSKEIAIHMYTILLIHTTDARIGLFERDGD